MPVKKLSKPNGKVAAKRKPAAKSSAKAASQVKGARRSKTGPMAAVLTQSKGVQGKVKKAGVKLGGVNKVLKKEIKKSQPATAIVRAVDKSADVEAKVQEAAADLAVVNEALSVESEVRRKIERELKRSEVALTNSREMERRARYESLHDQVTGLPNAALFSRRSGDEFLFLMLEAKSSDNARVMAQRIIAEIGRPVVIQEVKLSVSASVGLAMFPADGTTVATLLNKADLAMYEAKGRQRATR